MNALVALGAGAAYLYSLLATFAPGVLPEGARHSYFESAAAIVAFILLGRWLEARAKGRAAQAIAGLARCSQKSPMSAATAASVDLPVDEVRVGDLVEIRPGEPIPVDGVVVEGASHVDEALMTGESLPVAKKPGDALTGGAVNLAGFLLMRAEQVGEGTALAGIIRLVEGAQGGKLPIQALADKVTAIFVPAVLALAALTFALWMFFGPQSALALALVNTVNVLIIACPCAMGLATPAALMTGTGRGAQLGILFRRGDALQKLAGVKTVAFDKTGTLTLGQPHLTALRAEGFGDDEALALAAAVESRSEHPLARALVEAARARGWPFRRSRISPISRASASPPGSAARKSRSAPANCWRRWARVPPRLKPKRMRWPGRGPASSSPSTARRRPFSPFPIRCAPRRPPPSRRCGNWAWTSPCSPATGPRRRKPSARKSGVSEIFAGLKPEGKVEVLRKLSARGPVAFVGDGVNDAPALAAADVGLAMGTGSEIARASAEVVLVGADPAKAAQAVALSRATLRNIKQNLFWAFGYNVVLIPVAMGALYPWNGTLLNPAFGAAAMACSSLFVLGNALRLRAFAT